MTNPRSSGAIAVLMAVLISAGASTLSAQTPASAGYRDFSFGTTSQPAPTGEKPESKLWWNDGSWWGSLFSPSANAYRIFQFDANSQSWSDTGTTLDSRTSSKADALWDDASGHLYVVSHPFTTNAKATSTSSQWGRLFRYSYNSSTRRYSLDAGFPVAVTRGTPETLVIAKDSTGRLWVTFVEGGKVKINWSLTSDLDWSTPVDLPVTASTIAVYTDDISSIIAFGGGNVGVMWSNQLTHQTFFAVHRDSDAPDMWQGPEVVLPNGPCSGACADDHINLKTDAAGRVLAAVKTSLDTSNLPQLMLVVRSTTGQWAAYTVTVGRDRMTRPILLLDEQHGQLYFFATAPEDDGAIYIKTSPLNSPAFQTGRGDLFIASADDLNINNATSTKQNVDSSTGVVVLASDGVTRRYLHNSLALGGSGGPSGVPAAPTQLTAAATSAGRVDLAWTDASSNETEFRIERSTAGGPFSEIASVGANVTTFADTTVAPGTAYTYRVRAGSSIGLSPYSNDANVTTPQSSPATRLRDITFESGSLTGTADGAQKVAGAVTLETAAPLNGAYSSRITPAEYSYVEQSMTATGGLYLSFYLRMNALPSGPVRLVIFTSAGTIVGNVLLQTNGTLRLRVGTTKIGNDSTPLLPGQSYRVGLHQEAGTGTTGVLEAYVASGNNAFDQPFAANRAGTWTTATDRMRLGATGTDGGDLALDDIRLDTGAMPGASN